MKRDEAIKLIKENVKTQSLINHMFSTEAIMERLAENMGEDKTQWALCGLLHDIDFDITRDNPKEHGTYASKILKDTDVDKDIIHSIHAHNFEYTNITPETKMDFALISADAMTGLIIACAMVKEKKLENVSDKTIKKAFKKKGFAEGSKRDNIKLCAKAGISYDDFVTESREAMMTISEILGL
ncbi:MAG: HDIG domain-containing protein [DPANN group archaeon]|nr:HDIG domain-containing protein [DPANN group archaeon]